MRAGITYITATWYQHLIWTLLLLFMVSCHGPAYLVKADYHRYEMDRDTLETSAGKDIHQIILPYKSQLDEKMDAIIGMVPVDLKKNKIESTLGNWMADAISWFVQQQTGRQVDLAICNYGGIRIPALTAGPLTVGDIYELMPFDNYVVTMELDSATLSQLLKRMAAYGGWPVSSGLRLEVLDDHTIHARIHGEPVSPQKTYLIALSDYLANGGDHLDFLTSIPYNNLNVYYRDALIMAAKYQKEITADIEGRIKYLNHK